MSYVVVEEEDGGGYGIKSGRGRGKYVGRGGGLGVCGHEGAECAAGECPDFLIDCHSKLLSTTILFQTTASPSTLNQQAA